MSLYRIILEPIVTEKASIADVKNNVIVVKVASEATKIDIKNAFRTIYNIEVESVNVTAVREKFKNGRKWSQIKRRFFKKAYVTLPEGKKVEFSIVK